jgi:ribosomal protein S3
MLTFVDAQVQGAEGIMQYLTQGVKFQQIAHNVLSCDAQPTGQGVLVFITGQCKVWALF